jgi:hypothetical protein
MIKEEYEEKISMIDKDIERLRKEAGSEKQLSALILYRDYLKDEIDQLNGNGS